MASQNTTSFNGVLYRSMAGKVSTGRARGVRLVLKRTGVSGTACCFINSRAHPSTLAYAYNRGGACHYQRLSITALQVPRSWPLSRY